MICERVNLTSLCILLMLFAVLTVGWAVSPAYAESPIKIAMITAKTGVAGATNIVSFDAAQFVVKEINEQGGILGRKVKLLEYDNKSTPEGSAEAARAAIKDGAVAVVGCNWSSHSIAMAKVLQEAGIPMISHMSTNEAVTKVGDFIFRICFTDSFQGGGLARFARARLKCKTAVVLVDENRAYSMGLAKTFTEAFERLGGLVVWTGGYREDDDVDEILKKVLVQDPDALFVPGGYSDVGKIFGRARDFGLRAELLSADGIGMKMFEYIGEKANGIYYSGHWSRWVDTPLSKRFVKEFEAEHGAIKEDTQPLVYDSFMLFKDAMERAGSTDGKSVRDALATTQRFEGVTGEISFDENGDPIKPLVISELKFGGSMYLERIMP
ncbi:ABC transporter substrate-binding protein [Pseudodesulfovibrio sp. zrk46]|uniref:ABC transporter substrate-binding protein n=1 Tax=Pseudodesulfovibrio sp. zrk46 TaxID=2725288 RepID=UPI00144992E4|nr:ABC transporter substrate-binding protein [Pseudodesulfovibrio sp. zrk46]QJB54932.1 ABC transporter substrate-binding protein [Pseudodesulfovibrio sp. zrk46]